jgi:hypothetical protein
MFDSSSAHQKPSGVRRELRRGVDRACERLGLDDARRRDRPRGARVGNDVAIEKDLGRDVRCGARARTPEELTKVGDSPAHASSPLSPDSAAAVGESSPCDE